MNAEAVKQFKGFSNCYRQLILNFAETATTEKTDQEKLCFYLDKRMLKGLRETQERTNTPEKF